MQCPGGDKPYRSRLRADSGFFFELQFCYENGLAHSEFLEWDPADRAKLLAFAAEKAERCQMCGTGAWEWDPHQGGSRHAYEAVERFCPGCYAKAAMRTMEQGRNTDGITVELARNDKSPQAAQRHVRSRRQAKEQR